MTIAAQTTIENYSIKARPFLKWAGGKSKSMHIKKRKGLNMTRGYTTKTGAMGMVQRRDRVKAKVIKIADTETLVGGSLKTSKLVRPFTLTTHAAIGK